MLNDSIRCRPVGEHARDIQRRDFLKCGGAGLAGGCLAGSTALDAAQSTPSAQSGEEPSAGAVAMSHTTELRAPHQLPPENEMSRRYLRILEKWIPVGVEYFADWPGRPNCGHFFGGCWWYGLDTASPAEAFAVASISPEYNAAATGISRDQLREMAVKAIRYLGFTHDTGPRDCVRPSVGLGHPKLLGGTKWGERGKGFFPESHCGWVIAALGRIALLLRDKLDDETWMMLARVHEDYARRFGDMPPGSGIYRNTQLEENGWTAAGLTSSSLVLSRHPKAAQWGAAARRWMFSTCSAPQDTGNGAQLGRPAWLNVDDRIGVRFTGPGTAIYHNRHYHPRYRAIADDLVLSRLEHPQTLRAGEATAPLVALLIPEQNHADTVRSELCTLTGPDDTACLATGGYLAAANFAPAGGVTVFRGRRPERIDVYAGTTIQIRGEDREMHVPLAGRSA